MVVKSQGSAEGELAKGVRAAAALGGAQADHRRTISENALRRAEHDKQAAASILEANVEKDVHVAEADVAAMDKELEEIREKGVQLEEQQKAFAERAIGELEEEAAQAEDDLRNLEMEKHKLAELVAEQEAEAEREEKRAAVEHQEEAAAEIVDRGLMTEPGDERLVGKIEGKTSEATDYGKTKELQNLADEAHMAEAQVRTAIHRAHNVLAHARREETSADSKPAHVYTTGTPLLEPHLKEHEAEVTAAEREVEMEKDDDTAARLALSGVNPVLNLQEAGAIAHANTETREAARPQAAFSAKVTQASRQSSTTRGDSTAPIWPHVKLNRPELYLGYENRAERGS